MGFLGVWGVDKRLGTPKGMGTAPDSPGADDTKEGTMTYNGWKNYETWAVGLWLDNDEGSQAMVREWTREAWLDAPSGESYGVLSDSQVARFTLADTAKEWAEEAMPDLGASLWSDLLRGAMSEVDWIELADAWLEAEELDGYEPRDVSQ